MCHAMPFSACALKKQKTFIWRWCRKKQIEMWFIVGLWISVDKLITSQLATPCWRDPARSKQLSTVAILGFQLGLYHVAAPLSFLRSIKLVDKSTDHDKPRKVWSVQAAHLHIVVKNKFVADSLGCALWVHNILTTVMSRVVVDKSAG